MTENHPEPEPAASVPERVLPPVVASTAAARPRTESRRRTASPAPPRLSAGWCVAIACTAFVACLVLVPHAMRLSGLATDEQGPTMLGASIGLGLIIAVMILVPTVLRAIRAALEPVHTSPPSMSMGQWVGNVLLALCVLVPAAWLGMFGGAIGGLVIAVAAGVETRGGGLGWSFGDGDPWVAAGAVTGVLVSSLLPWFAVQLRLDHAGRAVIAVAMAWGVVVSLLLLGGL